MRENEAGAGQSEEWDDRLEVLRHSTAILSVVSPDGFPFAVRVGLELDAAARWIGIVHVPTGLPLAPGRACLATDAPDVFWLQNVRTGKCLDVYAYGTHQGDPVIQYRCLIGTNQQWRMLWSYNDGYALFQNVNSGLCLSVDGLNTADYRRYTQNPCYWWAANEQLHPMLP